MAQAFGVSDIFSKTAEQLEQDIEAKKRPVVAIKEEIHISPYDARLMTKAPSRKTSQEEIQEILQPFVDVGLKLRFDEERWYMSIGNKTDEGTLRMPLRVVVECAKRIYRG